MDNIPSKHSKTSYELDLLIQAAVLSAMQNKWKEAAKINQQILSLSGDDVEALNRLARAHTCLGRIPKAQKIYKKVLEIDPHNIIARKNVERLVKVNGGGHNNGQTRLLDGQVINGQGSNGNLTNIFIYEPGKTKLINLLNLAPPAVLATLACGDQLLMNPKKHAIVITSYSGTYLGALPDDLAHKLISFIN